MKVKSAKFVSGIHKFTRIPQTVSGLRNLFKSELGYEQLKSRAGIVIYSNAEFEGKNLIIVNGIREQISKHLLTKSVDVTFYYFGAKTE